MLELLEKNAPPLPTSSEVGRFGRETLVFEPSGMAANGFARS